MRKTNIKKNNTNEESDRIIAIKKRKRVDEKDKRTRDKRKEISEEMRTIRGKWPLRRAREE